MNDLEKLAGGLKDAESNSDETVHTETREKESEFSMLIRMMNENARMMNENAERMSELQKSMKEMRNENAERSAYVEQRLGSLENRIGHITEDIEEKLHKAIQVWEVRQNKLSERVATNSENMKEVKSKVNELVEQCERVDVRVNECEQRVEGVEEEHRDLVERFTRLDTKCSYELNEANGKIESVEGEIANVDDKLARLKQNILLDVQRKINKGSGCVRETSFEEECRKRDLKFGNHREHDPIKYINHIRQICKDLEFEWEKVDIGLSKIMCGEAACWYSLVQRNIESFEQFEVMFREKFCGDGYRNYVLDLLTGNYLKFSHVSPSEYLTDLANRLIELDMFTEKALSQRFARHFGNRIYLLCTTRRSETLSEVIEVINMFDKQTILQDMRAQPEIGLGNIQILSSNQNSYGNNWNRGTTRVSEGGVQKNNYQNYRGRGNGNGPYRGQQVSQPRDSETYQKNDRNVADGYGKNKERRWEGTAVDQGETKKIRGVGGWPKNYGSRTFVRSSEVQGEQSRPEDSRYIQTVEGIVDLNERDEDRPEDREL